MAITSSWSPSTSSTEASKVPPPKSTTASRRRGSCLPAAYAIAAAAGSLTSKSTDRPASAPARRSAARWGSVKCAGTPMTTRCSCVPSRSCARLRASRSSSPQTRVIESDCPRSSAAISLRSSATMRNGARTAAVASKRRPSQRLAPVTTCRGSDTPSALAPAPTRSRPCASIPTAEGSTPSRPSCTSSGLPPRTSATRVPVVPRSIPSTQSRAAVGGGGQTRSSSRRLSSSSCKKRKVMLGRPPGPGSDRLATTPSPRRITAPVLSRNSKATQVPTSQGRSVITEIPARDTWLA